MSWSARYVSSWLALASEVANTAVRVCSRMSITEVSRTTANPPSVEMMTIAASHKESMPEWEARQTLFIGIRAAAMAV